MILMILKFIIIQMHELIHILLSPKSNYKIHLYFQKEVFHD